MSKARAVLTRELAGIVLRLAAVSVVLCARADAMPAKIRQIMAIGCRIGVTAEGEAIRIDAIASSRKDASGRYRLDIKKVSAGGASHNIQSGEFNLEANSEKILSTTFLGASDAGHFEVRLVLDSDSGSVSCVSL